MWLASKQGFFSITKALTPPDDVRVLQVRARAREHLEALLVETGYNDIPIIETKDSDYGYRAFVSKSMVKDMMTLVVEGIDYSNFKSAATKRHGNKSPFVDFLHRVWGAGLTMQPFAPFSESKWFPTKKSSQGSFFEHSRDDDPFPPRRTRSRSKKSKKESD